MVPESMVVLPGAVIVLCTASLLPSCISGPLPHYPLRLLPSWFSFPSLRTDRDLLSRRPHDWGAIAHREVFWFEKTVEPLTWAMAITT